MKRTISNDVVRFRLFLISYMPLWLMLAFRSLAVHVGWRWAHRDVVSVVFALLAIWSFIDARRLVAGAQKTGSRRFWFGEIADQGGNAAGYLATYLLPFIGLVPAGWGDWAAYAIYFVVAAVVFVRTDLSLVNPTLYLMRWRVVAANAYSGNERAPDQLVWPPGVIVVCRDPRALCEGSVHVVDLGGCFVTKAEQPR
jgi:hypothetical protein